MTGVVISSSLVIAPGVDGLTANNPIIGYLTEGEFSATSEADDFPVTNLQNPSTYLKWMAEDASPQGDQYLTIIFESANDVDYIGIAAHNFGSGRMPVSVEYLDDTVSPTSWTELIAPVLMANDGPILFRFTPAPFAALRVRIQPSMNAIPDTPFAAVMYVGKLLILQRRIYVGHTPAPYGRELGIANHRSIAGNFLGRIVLRQTVKTSVDMDNLTPLWYRENFEPFLRAAQEIPFFFGWRPGDYPAEIGYVWLTDDPQPVNQAPNGLMQISFSMEGVV